MRKWILVILGIVATILLTLTGCDNTPEVCLNSATGETVDEKLCQYPETYDAEVYIWWNDTSDPKPTYKGNGAYKATKGQTYKAPKVNTYKAPTIRRGKY